jgi:hypothetical protein
MLFMDMAVALVDDGYADDHARSLARTLLTLVRRHDPATRDLATFGHGDTIPPDVQTVYDVEGWIWDRAGADTYSDDHWRAREHDNLTPAHGVEPLPTVRLIAEHGPLTQLAIAWLGTR